jgi:hypothetical protein
MSETPVELYAVREMIAADAMDRLADELLRGRARQARPRPRPARSLPHRPRERSASGIRGTTPPFGLIILAIPNGGGVTAQAHGLGHGRRPRPGHLRILFTALLSVCWPPPRQPRDPTGG